MVDKNKHVDQSNDGGEFTEQQGGSGVTEYDGSGQPTNTTVNDQGQTRAQTDANLQARQDQTDPRLDAGVVEPGPNDDPNDMRFNNPDNPPVETRPAEVTAPTEDTPGYQPQNG